VSRAREDCESQAQVPLNPCIDMSVVSHFMANDSLSS
jgi:hypothetical protein